MLITNASRLDDFFRNFFFVPKIVPKVYSKMVEMENYFCIISQ